MRGSLACGEMRVVAAVSAEMLLPRAVARVVPASLTPRSRLKKQSGGEFGWGGTSVTRQRRCPKISSMRTEISCRPKGEKLI